MELSGKKIHFMGMGGIGVSALALMAKSAGAQVSGCDRSRNEMTDILEKEGVRFHLGHSPGHAVGVDLLVSTSAVPKDHPERMAAAATETRGRFLARFVDAAPSACGISGTHGKTTTSWLLAQILLRSGMDPSVYVGGMTRELPGRNHRIGTGPFVAELDESDGSFLLPRLSTAVITNVESDHLSHYGSEAALFAAFRAFAGGVSESGLLIAGVDSPEANRIYSAHRGRKLSFGRSERAELRARNIIGYATGSRFRAWRGDRDLGRFSIGLPGSHNVQNALAALAAALEMGVEPDAAREALAGAQGIARRMERLGRYRDVPLYSDYAHHPTEVAAAIDAVRQLHPGPNLIVFQPHLYSRTRDYAREFGAALARADSVLVTDVFPAREEPIPGVGSELLVRAAEKMNADVHGPVPLSKVEERVRELVPGREAVVMMGAGDIDSLARKMAAEGAGD